MKQQNLVSVSVFFRNDTPHGFGVTIDDGTYTALSNNSNDVWEGFRSECGDNDDCIAGILLTQLEDWCVDFANQTMKQKLLCVMNVVMLTEHGYLPNDEFNGTQFCYVESGEYGYPGFWGQNDLNKPSNNR